MNFFNAVILGIIQGLTEFIPVSSTAHLLIAEYLMKIPADTASLAFSVIIQLGTTLALVLYFWKDLVAIFMETLTHLKGLGNFKGLPENAKLGWYIIIATIPALLAGYFFKKLVDVLYTQQLIEASIRLFSAAILMALAEFFASRKRKLDSMNWLDALIIGIMQIIAVLPGASRSATTISGGLLRGFDRPSAARFSFLMSVPVMIAAGAYEMLDVLKLPNLNQLIPLVLTGFVFAAIVGWFSIRWLLAYLNKNSLYAFVIYCAAAGFICLGLQFIK